MSELNEPALEPQLEAQALAVLQREKPTRLAVGLFDTLSWLLVLAVSCTLFYLVLVLVAHVAPETAQPIAILTAILYFLVIPFAALNIPVFIQLQRVGTLQQRLAPSWKSRVQARLAARRAQRPIVNWALRGVNAVGWLALAWGTWGLYVEITYDPIEPAGFLLVAAVMSLGVALVILPHLMLGHERLGVIAELWTALRSGKLSAYDEVARFDRELIKADREKILRSKTAGATASYAYRESRAVRETKESLEAGVLMDVLAHIGTLIRNPPRRQPDSIAEQVRYDVIGNTGLELGYCVDHDAREISLLSLAPPTSATRAACDSRQASAGYTVSVADAAETLAKALSPDQRKAFDKIVGTLAQDPARYANLATQEEGGDQLLEHPSPPLAIAYNVDEAAKKINVGHVSSPAPAARNLFISYSHADGEAWKTLKPYLKPLQDEGKVCFWIDELIEAGAEWNEEIQIAIDNAHGALLLVSQKFLASDFINKSELPYLFDRAANGKTKVLWVPIKPSTVFKTHPRITALQSLLVPPETPLSKLEEKGEASRDEALVIISERLREALVG